MAQFQVPQFIETEDKIIGPFTLRQFLYVGTAGLLVFFLYFILNSIGIWLLLSMALTATAFSLGFVKINGRDLPKVLLSGLRFAWRPQTFVWQPKNPRVQKTKQEMHTSAKKMGFSLDNIMRGEALKKTWHTLQSASKKKKAEPGTHEKYEIIRQITGERRAAKRVDYK